MEIKTNSDCLSAIDFAMVENVKLLTIQGLEDIHNRCSEIGMNDYIEDRIELEKALKHKSCIIVIILVMKIMKVCITNKLNCEN